MTYKVEKGVPYPRKKEEKYPFSKMDLGDSFTFPDEEKKEVCKEMRAYGKKTTMEFQVNPWKNPAKPEGRCWRTK